MHSGDWVIYGA